MNKTLHDMQDTLRETARVPAASPADDPVTARENHPESELLGLQVAQAAGDVQKQINRERRAEISRLRNLQKLD